MDAEPIDDYTLRIMLTTHDEELRVLREQHDLLAAMVDELATAIRGVLDIVETMNSARH
jgi:hypothetical protein